MNNTLFTVCYSIKAGPYIQGSIAGLKPLGSSSDLPRQLEEESVPAGIKGQLQKLAGLSEWYSIISPINGTDT